MLAFGPIPSRRLGRSLGINNIPPKVCTYSCIYCQVGRTTKMNIEPSTFYEPQEILKDVKTKVKKAKDAGEPIDYLTFVPDGEPTLDINLGCEIELLKPLGIKIAVITNASLIWHTGVRENLMKADWVSLKIDTVTKELWQKINRPHRSLQFNAILEGSLEFAKAYRGKLATETMLVKGVNDSDDDFTEVADFLAKIKPAKAYISIPIRPPTKKWVKAPSEEVINRAYQILRNRIEGVEYLIGYEGNAFAFTGNVEEDLLSIVAVHPMRKEGVENFLAQAKASWSVIDKLITQGHLIEVVYRGKTFYMRRLETR